MQNIAQKPTLNIDLKRILFRSFTNWYFFVITIGIGVVWAFLFNRYATRTYPIGASILFFAKDETSSGAELLYRNALSNTKVNHLNDTYLMKSNLIIKRVIENLSFNVFVYVDGDISSTEVYDLPFSIACNSIEGSGEYSFRILDSTSFLINYFRPQETNTFSKEVVYKFRQTANFDDKQFDVKIKNRQKLTQFFNKELRIVVTPISSIADDYSDRLSLRWAEEGSGVMNISIFASTPQREIDFIEALIKTFQRYDLDQKNQTADRTVAFIKSQLEMVSDSLRQFEAQLEKFKQAKHTIGDFNQDAQRMLTRAESFESQKATLLLRSSYYNYLQDYLNQGESLDQVILPSSLDLSDPILSTLLNKIMDIQVDTKLFLEKDKSRVNSNPLIDARIEKIVALKNEVKESMKNQLNLDKIKIDFLSSQIKGIDKLFESIPFNQRRLISITRKYSLYETLYLFLLQKKAEGEISRSGNASDLVVINPPRIVGGSITPAISQNYFLGIVAGFGIPLLIIFLIEILNNKVLERSDIERFTSIPIIGGVGHKKGDGNLQVLNDTKSPIAESFRALRSNLSYFVGNKPNAVFVVTSSISGEGKTFTSLNLASILSLSLRKTLLVGADLRKPKLSSEFQLRNDVGLSSYLAGINSFEEVVQQTSFESLYVVAGGPVPPNPSELLMGDRLNQFIVSAKAEFDYIVIDTAPMSLVTDSYSLFDFADHIIFVVRQKYTPKHLLRTVDEAYETKKIKNVSIIFNDLYSGLGFEFTDGYSYTYGYKKSNYGYYS